MIFEQVAVLAVAAKCVVVAVEGRERMRGVIFVWNFEKIKLYSHSIFEISV